MARPIEQTTNWPAALQCVEVLDVRGSQATRVEWQATGDVEIADLAFRAVRKKSTRLHYLLTELERRKLRYCIFGGWLRDTLLGRTHDVPLPRDVDLVVSGVDVDLLVQTLSSDVRPTLFGGVQSLAPPMPFDVWPLHETFLIKFLGLPPTFDSLLETADFDINAGLYFPSQAGSDSVICEGGMLTALHKREINFNAAQLPFPVLQCARLAVYAGKLGFSLAPPVVEFMREILGDPTRKSEVLAGLANYNSGANADRAVAIISAVMDTSA